MPPIDGTAQHSQTPGPGHQAGAKIRPQLWNGLVFTIILLGSIALAIRQTYPGIALLAVVAVLALVVVFHFALGATDFFGVIFANSVGVYTCLYIVFLASNFPGAGPTEQQVGYLLPLLGFAGGVLAGRRRLHPLVAHVPRHRATAFQGAALWVGPLAMVAIVSSFLRIPSWDPSTQDLGLILSMAVIGVIGFGASRRILLFLIETGAVFSAFFANAVRLVQPAFALLTCYSLVIILFGAAYTIFDQMSVTPNFAALGSAAPISFPDGLYLSVATLTMVGYGDITPISAVARLFVSIELICGVVLLLFGVEAMLERSTQAENPRPDHDQRRHP
jgi:voltage-gated potassium channel